MKHLLNITQYVYPYEDFVLLRDYAPPYQHVMLVDVLYMHKNIWFDAIYHWCPNAWANCRINRCHVYLWHRYGVALMYGNPNIEIRSDAVMYVHTRTFDVTEISTHNELGIVVVKLCYIASSHFKSINISGWLLCMDCHDPYHTHSQNMHSRQLAEI